MRRSLFVFGHKKIKTWSSLSLDPFFSFGAVDRNRTCMGLTTRSLAVRVCQFRHDRIKLSTLIYYNITKGKARTFFMFFRIFNEKIMQLYISDMFSAHLITFELISSPNASSISLISSAAFLPSDVILSILSTEGSTELSVSFSTLPLYQLVNQNLNDFTIILTMNTF